MMSRLRRAALALLGHDATPATAPLPNADPLTAEVLDLVRPYTMVSAERVDAMVRAVRYVVEHDVPGDIVECGVWRGGSIMTACLVLQRLLATDRTLYLFDTFEGMPAPDDVDARRGGEPAATTFEATRRAGGIGSDWCYASLADVQRNVLGTGYPAERIRFVPGLVESTTPMQAPATISLLRLDTDWYASTRHELAVLYPRLVTGGVLIVDDYGTWLGARKAVDEFMAAKRPPLLLQRIDGTGVMAVKLAS